MQPSLFATETPELMQLLSRSFWRVLGLSLLLMGGCSGPREGEEAPNRRATKAPAEATTDLTLVPPSDAIHTIQLYPRQGDKDAEDQIPVVPLGANPAARSLVLEFDLMEPTGRPLSVYFYHADREWNRDLFAAEYLDSFDHDDLFDYQSSRATQVPYTHYRYTFPNRSIKFRISGNYILRVTEQGNEDDVLFERPFFVSEDAAALNLGVDNVIVGNSGYPASQPILSFRPPAALAGNVFDYNVCFVRNGRLEKARCSSDPSLTQQPDLLFYLQPEQAFPPQDADFFLDFVALRVGGPVEALDRTVTPPEVLLEPDYARFPTSGLDPLLNGQTVVSGAVRDVGTPDIEGEYASVTFRYVPDAGQRLPGALLLSGSFNGWGFDLANELQWDADNGRYEGTLLLKQGRYEYRYTSPDPRARQALVRSLPRAENLYAAFVYFSDTSLNTDRLLAAQTVRGR